jgi:hypothetical protein
VKQHEAPDSRPPSKRARQQGERPGELSTPSSLASGQGEAVDELSPPDTIQMPQLKWLSKRRFTAEAEKAWRANVFADRLSEPFAAKLSQLEIEQEVRRMSSSVDTPQSLFATGRLAKFIGASGVEERGACISTRAIAKWWDQGYKVCARMLMANHLLGETNANLFAGKRMSEEAAARVKACVKQEAAKVQAAAWGNKLPQQLGRSETSNSKVLLFEVPTDATAASAAHVDGVGHGMDRAAISFSAAGRGQSTGDFYGYEPPPERRQ